MTSAFIEDEFLEKMFGPTSPDYLKFKASAEKIKYKKEFGDGISTTPHYRIDGCVFSECTLRGYYEWRNFCLRKDDIVVTSFPKTGTTWIQEVVYHVMHVEDVDKSDQKSIDDRFPFMECPDSAEVVKNLRESSSPRLIKSHLPFSLLPPGECNKQYKIIYICRNPKDTVVSLYHFYKAVTTLTFNGSFQSFVKIFFGDSVIYSPFWKHILEFWDHKNDSNVLFMKYEDLHKNLKEGVRKVADFLGQNLTNEQISKIAQRCSFSEMSINPASNHSQWEGINLNSNVSKFMRKGEVGNWKCFLDDEINKQMDDWIATNVQNSDLSFDYE